VELGGTELEVAGAVEEVGGFDFGFEEGREEFTL
jgi:hypothetical protein